MHNRSSPPLGETADLLRTLLRNYRNAGARSSVSLCVQKERGNCRLDQVFRRRASGSELHALALEGRRSLDAQIGTAGIPEEPWAAAAAVLSAQGRRVSDRGADDLDALLPFVCFLSDCFSPTYADGEHRDVCITQDGDVIVYSFAGGRSKLRELGNFREHAREASSVESA